MAWHTPAMEVRYSLTVDDYVAFQEHFAATSPVIRRQQQQLRAFGVLFCLVTALLFIGVVRSDWTGAAVVAVLAAAAVWFLASALNRWVVQRSVRAAVVDGGAGPLGQARLTLGDAGVTEEAAGTTTTVTWEAVDRLEESTDHYYVFTAPAAAIIVPRRAPGSAELIAALRARTDSTLS